MKQENAIQIFEDKKTEAQNYINQIQKIDKELDSMIYALYDLSAEEIKMVEQ